MERNCSWFGGERKITSPAGESVGLRADPMGVSCGERTGVSSSKGDFLFMEQTSGDRLHDPGDFDIDSPSKGDLEG